MSGAAPALSGVPAEWPRAWSRTLRAGRRGVRAPATILATMTRDDFNTATIEQRDEFMAWCAEQGVDASALARSGEAVTVEGHTITLHYEDGTTRDVAVEAFTDIPRVVLGRF